MNPKPFSKCTLRDRQVAYNFLQGTLSPERLGGLLLGAERAIRKDDLAEMHHILNEAYHLIAACFLEKRDSYKALVKKYYELCIKFYIELAELNIKAGHYAIGDQNLFLAEFHARHGGLELPEKFNHLSDKVDIAYVTHVNVRHKKDIENPGDATTN